MRRPPSLAVVLIVFAGILLGDLSVWVEWRVRRAVAFGVMFPLAVTLGCPCCGPPWYGRLCARLVRLAGEKLPPELEKWA